MMKPIQIALAPTRSRALNMFLGLVLALVSLLLFSPSPRITHRSVAEHLNDPAVRTLLPTGWAPLARVLATSVAIAWVHSVFCASVVGGLAGLGVLAIRRFGLAALASGRVSLVFLPAVFGLLPWHWRWMHAIPVEGVMGRLVAACWWRI